MVFVARTETPVTIEVEGVGANGISTLQPRGSGALAVIDTFIHRADIPIVMVPKSASALLQAPAEGEPPEVEVLPYPTKTLWPADEVTRRSMATAVNRAPPGGKSFYLPPFQKAYDMLARSRSENEYCTGQQLIIL